MTIACDQDERLIWVVGSNPVRRAKSKHPTAASGRGCVKTSAPLAVVGTNSGRIGANRLVAVCHRRYSGANEGAVGKTFAIL